MTALALQPAGIELLNTTDNPLDTISEGLTKIPPLATDADGEFTLTFDTGDLVDEDNSTANAELQSCQMRLPMKLQLRLQALTALDDNDSGHGFCHYVETALEAIKTG